MNLSDTLSPVEPTIEPEVLESMAALPTEEDLPCDDGEPMETARHREQMSLLIDSLKRYWSQRTDYYVGGNMFIHYDLRNRRRFRGPDFFLVLDVEDRERKSWVVWQEEMRFPDVIIELLSDSTRNVDKGEKKTLYERVFRTEEYYLYDPFSHELVGYHLHGTRYQESPLDTQGRIYSPATGLFLVVRNERLRWLTPEGEVVPSPMELADQEQERANQEQQRANQEQERANQEQQRADQERQRAELEQQRADQERQRAELAQQRVEQAEQLLEAYQRRFGKLE